MDRVSLEAVNPMSHKKPGQSNKPFTGCRVGQYYCVCVRLLQQKEVEFHYNTDQSGMVGVTESEAKLPDETCLDVWIL